ncbi:Inosine-uridine-preferring nucleoside hydrolase [Galdieria sulphuraria]|uniref:Purine nucleosidase n=1 Tax=Galdieria sulphuraria TaxID=130081 RepID=M2X198_GALSU|nr:purine nucleosidase [Galdieria sulphuraria]EME30140.1 purine nucleosidase [Galdieria sulphuraria]GJD11599.1 Inosine-uridine-preferring nucleoside hydrolase [Galdieria sulphuraria]|eukprot:XP_005706660.1 purine nucleosidase [Galdieria sulphuraria]
MTNLYKGIALQDKVDIMKERRPTPVILDCDPGHDDAFAIVLAAFSPEELSLLAITTVSGNQSLEKTTLNALRILHACGFQENSIPVAKGASAPLMLPELAQPKSQEESISLIVSTHYDTSYHQPLVGRHPVEVHGESGMDGAEFPSTVIPKLDQRKAWNLMADIVQLYSPEFPLTIIATGPLTNIALFVTLYPELRRNIRIVFMGGTFERGNIHPTAEFNILHDPEAAHIVFHCGVSLTMVPLDLTHQVLVTQDILGRIHALNTPFAKNMAGLVEFFRNSYQKTFGFASPPLHDPCAVAYVLDASRFETQLIRVEVETGKGLCAGQTVGDFYGRYLRKPKNVNVVQKMDIEWFWHRMLQSLTKANEQSPLNKNVNSS